MNKTQTVAIGSVWRPLDIRLYEAADPQGAVIIAPAIGVLKTFYHDIALFLIEQGFHVITFDYFGMVMNAGESPITANAISKFGTYDLDEVIRYSREKFQHLKVYFLGHSIGGQIFPLAEHAHEVTAAFLVGSQQVSHHLWQGVYKIQVQFFWRVLLPIAVRAYGYLPGFAYGGKHGLQKAIALDWSRLARTRTGMYEESEMSKSRYLSLNVPTTFVSLNGDNLLAPQAAVRALMNQYGSHAKRHIHLRLGESAVNPHFDFFKKSFQNNWILVTKFFKNASLVDGDLS
jgi:predicted alpha/beta hydrolase